MHSTLLSASTMSCGFMDMIRPPLCNAPETLLVAVLSLNLLSFGLGFLTRDSRSALIIPVIVFVLLGVAMLEGEWAEVVLGRIMERHMNEVVSAVLASIFSSLLQ